MSEIPYCEKTLEVTGGCTKCALGCRICWAIKEVWRMAHNPLQGDKWKGLVEKKNGVLNWTGRIKCFPEALKIPLRRKKPTTYFVNSKADLFHEKVPFEFVDKVLYVMYRNLQHTFLIFTKRPERMLEYFTDDELLLRLLRLFPNYTPEARLCREWPLENIQLILSISTQVEADEKIPILLQIPATVRGLSIEPMLEEIDIERYLVRYARHNHAPHKSCTSSCRASDLTKTHWVVVGSESGPGAMYCPIENIRGIVEQCKAASVPVFVKQIHLGGKAKAIKNINEFPEDLRIQQYPER